MLIIASAKKKPELADARKFASRFSTYFDKLSTIFMNMHSNCPRYIEYQTLYAGSERLQAALCNYYATVVRLCQKAIEVGQRQGEYLKSHSTSKILCQR